MGFERVCALDDVWAGQMRAFTVAGRRVLMVNTDRHWAAFQDRCAHLGVPLSEGRFIKGTLVCRAHEWQYDSRTGVGINPCDARLERLPLEIREDAVWVDVP